jgi:hypothetical protein
MQVGEFEKGANVGLIFTHQTSSFSGAHLSPGNQSKGVSIYCGCGCHGECCSTDIQVRFNSLIPWRSLISLFQRVLLCATGRSGRVLCMEILLLKQPAHPPTLCYFFHRAAYNDTSSPHITYLRVQGQVVAGSYSGYRRCNATPFQPLLHQTRSNPTATLRGAYF